VSLALPTADHLVLAGAALHVMPQHLLLWVQQLLPLLQDLLVLPQHLLLMHVPPRHLRSLIQHLLVLPQHLQPLHVAPLHLLVLPQHVLPVHGLPQQLPPLIHHLLMLSAVQLAVIPVVLLLGVLQLNLLLRALPCHPLHEMRRQLLQQVPRSPCPFACQ
jgi:hypothetical protein